MVNFLRPDNYAMKVDPTFKYAWINIPKNCSSFVQKVLDDNSWIDVADDIIDSVLSSNNIEKIVVLRDPVQRWISGFAETFSIQDDWDPILHIDLDKLDTLLDMEEFWKVIYVNPVMCIHTEHQHRHIGNAKNIRYIKLQDKQPDNRSVTDPNRFYRELTDYIRYTGGVSNFQHWTELTNPVNSDNRKLRVYNKILNTIQKDPSIKKELKDCHEQDYELFHNLERFTV